MHQQLEEKKKLTRGRWAQVLQLTLRRISTCDDSAANQVDFVPSFFPQLQGVLCYSERDDDLWWWLKVRPRLPRGHP
jgi:hypothetical protein